MKKILPIISAFILLTATATAQPTGSGPLPIVRFYPNPATTAVTFDFQKSYERGYTMQVFNFLGKKVYEATNVGPKTVINLSEFNRGIYIYQLYNRGGKLVESGKFQKTS